MQRLGNTGSRIRCTYFQTFISRKLLVVLGYKTISKNYTLTPYFSYIDYSKFFCNPDFFRRVVNVQKIDIKSLNNIYYPKGSSFVNKNYKTVTKMLCKQYV